MKAITFPAGHLALAGHLHLPAGLDDGDRAPALVVVHPGGGVKEQTAGLYAREMAEHGFVALAYDAGYQGESTGEPRHLEDPYQRVEDVRAAVDHLTTLPYVDPERIAVLGICAGGGYAINAAMTDSRMRAVGTVSGLAIGRMFRRGWDGTGDVKQTLGLRDAGAARRTAEANGEAVEAMPLAPTEPSPDLPPDLADAYEYYHTARAEHCNAPGKAPLSSLSRLVAYDAFNMAELLLTQPLLLVAGDQAGSLWHSQEIYERAASAHKTLHIVKGANHMDLYDRPAPVGEAVSMLVPFYREALR